MFNPEKVLAWAELQPAAEPYNYLDPNQCALAQFAAAHGLYYTPCAIYGVERAWTQEDRLEHLACQAPRTFGAFAQRIREEFQL